MVATVGSGESISPLFGARQQPAAPRAAETEAVSRSATGDRRPPGRLVGGGPPRGLLSFDAALALQTGQGAPERPPQAPELRAAPDADKPASFEPLTAADFRKVGPAQAGAGSAAGEASSGGRTPPGRPATLDISV